jgi:hypothetical protein
MPPAMDGRGVTFDKKHRPVRRRIRHVTLADSAGHVRPVYVGGDVAKAERGEKNFFFEMLALRPCLLPSLH